MTKNSVFDFSLIVGICATMTVVASCARPAMAVYAEGNASRLNGLQARNVTRMSRGEKENLAANSNQADVLAFDIQCKAGDMEGCYKLGESYRVGQGVAIDYARSFHFLYAACGGGNAAGCHNAGWLTMTGRGVDKDHAKAVALYEKACEGGNPGGCFFLGRLHEKGMRTPKDVAKAKTFYDRACLVGSKESCFFSSQLATNY